jgi:RNA polymerase sigma-70 factor (ECF subfamily)
MNPFLHALPSDESPDPSEEFVALLTRHQSVLLAFILGLVPNREDAEEIRQRANIVLWRKREDFKLGTSFRSWAFSVARWEARGFIRERGRKSWLVYDDEVAGLLADRLASLPVPALGDRADALRHCLGELNRDHRRLIVARYQEGLSFTECAERFSRSEGGLRVTLHRLKITLRRCVVKRLAKKP